LVSQNSSTTTVTTRFCMIWVTKSTPPPPLFDRILAMRAALGDHLEGSSEMVTLIVSSGAEPPRLGLKRICPFCDQMFEICQSCWRGQKYCRQACSHEARKRCRRIAEKKYANTAKGRECRRRRQKNFRSRRILGVQVTDQGSQTIPVKIQHKPKAANTCCHCHKHIRLLSGKESDEFFEANNHFSFTRFRPWGLRMTQKWNRKAKRTIEQTTVEPAIKTEVPAKFKVRRIRPKSRKRKPPGFTPVEDRGATAEISAGLKHFCIKAIPQNTLRHLPSPVQHAGEAPNSRLDFVPLMPSSVNNSQSVILFIAQYSFNARTCDSSPPDC
jgi:hypothetical protein